MAKRKLTQDILETIELCASDHYNIDEIRKEADITKPLMEDQQVIDAIERGRVKQLIEIVSTDGDLEHFIFYSGKSMEEVGHMFDEHEEAIEKKKAEIQAEKDNIKLDKIERTESVMDPLWLSSYAIEAQFKDDLHKKTIISELNKTTKQLRAGDNSYLINLLVSNITQLHLHEGLISRNIAGGAGEALKNFDRLISLQVKLMQETRKSIMAINEICNPKGTTFIKEANQHNHLHQENLEKIKNKNELQKTEQLPVSEQVEDAKVVPLKENVCEDK